MMNALNFGADPNHEQFQVIFLFIIIIFHANVERQGTDGGLRSLLALPVVSLNCGQTFEQQVKAAHSILRQFKIFQLSAHVFHIVFTVVRKKAQGVCLIPLFPLSDTGRPLPKGDVLSKASWANRNEPSGSASQYCSPLVCSPSVLINPRV